MSTHFKERLNAYGLALLRTYGDQQFMIADDSEQNRFTEGEITGYRRALYLRLEEGNFSIEIPVTGGPIEPLWVGSDSEVALDRLRAAFVFDDDIWSSPIRLREALREGP